MTRPDRPIRAARNWDALGPTAGWEGLQRGKTPPPRTKAPSTHRHYGHEACMPLEEGVGWVGGVLSGENTQQLVTEMHSLRGEV